MVIQGFKRIQNGLGPQRCKEDPLWVGAIVSCDVLSCLFPIGIRIENKEKLPNSPRGYLPRIQAAHRLQL